MNKVILMGRVTKDIEAKGDNTKYCSFSLAVNRRGKDAETDFINCKAFGKTCETLEKYVKKGSQIAIEGRIQTGSYEKDGKKIYTTDVIVDAFYFCGSKKDSADSSSTSSADGFYPIEDGSSDDLPF